MKTIRKSGPGFRMIDLALNSIKGKILKVGWVAQKKYPDGEMTTAEVGLIAEKGSIKRNIPPRPIMRPVIYEKLAYWRRISASENKKIFSGEQTGEGALELLGAKIAGDFRKRITEIQLPELKKETILGRIAQRNEGIEEYNNNRKKGQRKKKELSYEDVKNNATFKKPLVFTKVFLNSLTHSVENE